MLHFLLALGLCHSLAGAQTTAGWRAVHERIWDTRARRWTDLEDLSEAARAGDIFVFGETHATKYNATQPDTFIHHDNQSRLIHSLEQRGRHGRFSVSVGMEFLLYPLQSFVDQFLAGTLEEADFLKAAQWGGNPFAFYREQILAPRGSAGKTVALNIPMAVTGRVAQLGPQALAASDRAWLPPLWERGNDRYFARFAKAMQGHVTSAELNNFFWAQSLWDDTMAWRASLHRATHPQDILVIVVGEFHVDYGGGLPRELNAYGQAQVKTLVQIEADAWDEPTLQRLITPDTTYGARADYLWIHFGAKPLLKSSL